MPAGRPSKYTPEMADIAYATMAEGFSKTATAGRMLTRYLVWRYSSIWTGLMRNDVRHKR